LNAKGYGLATAPSVPPGFVKDPNSAWYINSTTGMYYDVNSKSYLHAATGKYYYLDVATNSLKEWASATVAAVPSVAVAEADKFLQVIPPAMQCLFVTCSVYLLIVNAGIKREARFVVCSSVSP
jgi:hypothetical protein